MHTSALDVKMLDGNALRTDNVAIIFRVMHQDIVGAL